MENEALRRSINSIIKYAFWTGVGAGIQVIINLLPGIKLPEYTFLAIAGILKGLATYVATKTYSL